LNFKTCSKDWASSCFNTREFISELIFLHKGISFTHSDCPENRRNFIINKSFHITQGSPIGIWLSFSFEREIIDKLLFIFRRHVKYSQSGRVLLKPLSTIYTSLFWYLIIVPSSG
jgi:hypothetical protein